MKSLLLNQVIALVTSKKPQFQKYLSNAKNSFRSDSVNGMIRVYTPFNDEDRNVPPNDSKGIAADARSIVREFEEEFANIVNLIATNDVGNQSAVADVCGLNDAGEEVVVLKDVPVTHLLYLEKALADLRAFVEAAPTLNPMQNWTYDDNRDCYVTEPARSVRTTKQKTRFVKAEATEHHPAQVEIFDEDVPVGTWATTYISTAFDGATKKNFLKRIDSLVDGVKKARERANSLQVEQSRFGNQIVDFVFGNDV